MAFCFMVDSEKYPMKSKRQGALLSLRCDFQFIKAFFLYSNNIDLAALHRGERCFVAFRRYPCATGFIYADVHFRIVCL